MSAVSKKEAQLKTADTRLRLRFGITPERKGGPSGYAGVAEYDRRLAEQGGVCAICERKPEYGKRFAVDHNHSTGRVRGLLCSVCNGRLIGRLERFKKRATLMQILAYLRKFDPDNPLLRGKP